MVKLPWHIINPLEAGKKMSSSIYYSLQSVLLTLSQTPECPEVNTLLKICENDGLVKEIDGKYLPLTKTISSKDEYVPFIVIEGLDGTGKTSLAAKVQQKYEMRAMQTPPENISHFREFFDNQSESVRRAFYSLGNYLAATKVLECTRPVIMDRFWHSTAAYALGTKSDDELKNINLDWPHDLLKPNLVIFLFVSEKERVRRHATRLLQTNTLEEQTLAKDQAFRENIVNIYRRIHGPRFLEINADTSMAEVEGRVFEELEKTFPSLQRSTN